MRRPLLVAAVLLLLATTAACGATNSGVPDASPGAGASPTAPADPAAATAQVCAEAVPLSEKAAARFMTDMNNALESAVSGSEADAEKALLTLRGNLDALVARLNELAGQPIDERVQAALAEAAAEIRELAQPHDETPVGQVESTLQGATDKIREACA